MQIGIFFMLQSVPLKKFFEALFEIVPQWGVDDEVDGGVDDQEEVVEAGEAEVGVGRHEVGARDQEVHPGPDT